MLGSKRSRRRIFGSIITKLPAASGPTYMMPCFNSRLSTLGGILIRRD